VTDLALADVLVALRTRGQEAYLGEPVTVTEHSLQTAAAAEAEGRSPALVVAALLHDVGWLLHAGPRPHEERGAAILAQQGFGPEVTEPVRLHVDAKRYLCTIDPDYRTRLSSESRRTLGPQGGILDEEAREAFAAHPFAADALILRRYDDVAKTPGARTPDLEHFARLVDALRDS
jgi:gamma-butyrobetaine dioxygenase